MIDTDEASCIELLEHLRSNRESTPSSDEFSKLILSTIWKGSSQDKISGDIAHKDAKAQKTPLIAAQCV